MLQKQQKQQQTDKMQQPTSQQPIDGQAGSQPKKPPEKLPLEELLPNGTENTAEELESVRKILKELKPPVPSVQNRGNMQKLLKRIGKGNSTEDEIAEANKKLQEYLFEGDILLNVQQARAIADGTSGKKKPRAKRQYSPFQSLWNKRNPIYYTIQGMSPSMSSMIRAAANFWTQKTCLTFVENPWASPRLRFLSLTGCWSSIGRQTGWNSQDISLGYGCESVGAAAHEIAHALGFYHTQSRPDRDYYVSINLGNIPYDKQKNFVRVYDSLGTSKHVTYDFGSVMQYGPYAFAKNPRVPTVLARDWRFQSTMGRREEPTFGDVKAVNSAYSCHESCQSQVKCLYGGFIDSKNCGSCHCPPYFSGNTCQSINRGSAPQCNSQVLTATTTWASFRGSMTASGNGAMEDCVWLIQAPTGRRIQLRMNNLSVNYCDASCSRQGVEVNTGNFDVTGMRFCCTNGASFNSDGPLVAIRSTSRSGSVSFDLHFGLL